MNDELDLRALDQRHEPDPAFRAQLRLRVRAISADEDPWGSSSKPPIPVSIDPETRRPRRPLRRVARGILLVAAAAAVVGGFVIITNREPRIMPLNPSPETVAVTSPATTVEAGTPASSPSPSILREPSREEVSAASDISTYPPLSGQTEITTTRKFASLRSCVSTSESQERVDNGLEPVAHPCSESLWAYATGTDDGDLHFGLLGEVDDVELSTVDERYFVASGRVPSSRDPGAPPLAWLIDSVTGARGALTWSNQPATLDGSTNALVLFDQPFPSFEYVEPFLPRVVDPEAGTIRPLAVPADASAAIPIAQLGTGRIWVGTAPAGGDLGLAYTDDGGATWTHAAFPEATRTTTQQFDVETSDRTELSTLSIAAAGERLAVTGGPRPGENRIFVSSDSGLLWQPATSLPTRATEPTALAPVSPENYIELYVLADGRLVILLSVDAYPLRTFVSASTSDWTQVEQSQPPMGTRSFFAVNQAGVAAIFNASGETPYRFSTDLVDWWQVPTVTG